MAFRLAPRTVWGTRRWFLGRETFEYTESYKEWYARKNPDFDIPLKRSGLLRLRKTKNWDAMLSRLRHKPTVDRYKADRAAGKLQTEKRETNLTKWSSRVYYANQFARTIWWYAQETGATDVIAVDNPELVFGFQMAMGMSTHVMGMIATSGAVIGGVATGQFWMAGAAALSLPIQ